ncbi:hypothetical protein J1N35_044354 [Gossypium stocksii]|uniref:Uncharacterized protein n=1 Tax=Gossypium stocksii TaxID=47602 RepID=A0A9D3ZFX4_9ROSI|nr:hypothetical protein J1N35_044354 [Gossypium stocksii]
MILTGCLEELANFFYQYYGMALRPFSLLKFKQKERVRGDNDLIITFINPRVSGSTGGNQGCEDSLSDSDNIFCELNKVMDIDALIGSGRKRRKTFVEATHINPSKLADTQAELKRVYELYDKVRKESGVINEKQGVLTKCLVMMEMKVVSVKLSSLQKKKGKAKEGHFEVARGPFGICNVSFDALADVDMSSLVIGGVTISSPAIEDVALVDLDKGGGDDALEQ